jgi:hypothetical protein
MGEPAAQASLVGSGTTTVRDRPDTYRPGRHSRREPSVPVQERVRERDQPPALCAFEKLDQSEKPLADFAAVPADTPMALTWGPKPT